MKHNKKRPFVIVYLDLVENGLSYEESALIRYVERFEQSNKPCFASIPYLSKDLRLTERSIRRHLKRLINLGYLRATGKGRGRYLNLIPAKMAGVNAAKMATDSGQIVTDRGQNGRYDTGQNGRLSNSIMINSNIHKNISISDIIKLTTNGDDMNQETKAEKERRLHLKQLWDDPIGWVDNGNVFTKWDETYKVLLRKAKPIHPEKSWNGNSDHNNIPD